MADCSNTPAWVQAGAAIIALFVTGGTYVLDSIARRSERRADEQASMRLAAFDLLSQAREWLADVKEAQRVVPETFDWINDLDANYMAGVVNAALDYGLHHIHPGGRGIVPLKSTGSDFYQAISLSNEYLGKWNQYPYAVARDEHHTEMNRHLQTWFANIRQPLESAVDGMDKIVNAMLKKWE